MAGKWRATRRRGSLLLMKLVATLIVLGGLAVAATWVPLRGQTLWQRAEQRGLPSTAARAMGNAARTVGTAATGVYRWANGSGPSKSAVPVRRAGEPRTAPAAALRAAPQAAAQAPAAARPAARKIALAPVGATEASPQEAAPTTAAAPAAGPGRDGIVRASAPEKLSNGDRAALDQLVSRARAGGK